MPPVLRRVIAEPRAVIGGAIMLSMLFIALAAPYLAPHDPAEQDLLRTLLPPAWLRGGDWAFPLGTDSLGRCTLSQLLFGARVAMTVAVAAASGASLVEAILSFVGLSVEPNVPAWGVMIADARQYMYQAEWGLILPVLGIFVTVLGANLLGDGLRRSLDPRLVQRLAVAA